MSNHVVYGKTYKSIKEIAIHYNVSLASLNHYIKKGYKIEDALKKIKSSTISEMNINVYGKTFITKKACLEYFDIKENSAFVYMKRHSCTFEEAICHLISYKQKHHT